MNWTFVYLMVGLKIPIAALLWLVWWAIHAEVEPAEDNGSDDGGTKVTAGRPRHPRSPLPRNPRRGPHGAPSPPSPARTRTVLARGRRRGLRSP